MLRNRMTHASLFSGIGGTYEIFRAIEMEEKSL